MSHTIDVDLQEFFDWIDGKISDVEYLFNREPTPLERLHGPVIGTRCDAYHDVTIYADGYEDRYYLGD